jgi:PTS system nitrogen regulatory IIA component
MTIDELIRHVQPSSSVLALQARDKQTVLTEITDALVERGHVKDRDVVLQMLRNREQLGSTAVGAGVAFPHGRSLAVQKLTILVARSAQGVDFGGLDGKPTRLFFVLMAPPQDSGNLYLQALGKLTELVARDDVRRALLQTADLDALVGILRGAGK